MPYDQVMHKFKHGELHSGSKSGPPVKNRKQAIAIMLSEKRKADSGDEEYKSIGHSKGSPASSDKGKKRGIFKRKQKHESD